MLVLYVYTHLLSNHLSDVGYVNTVTRWGCLGNLISDDVDVDVVDDDDDVDVTTQTEHTWLVSKRHPLQPVLVD